jgi:hypothetical protein
MGSYIGGVMSWNFPKKELLFDGGVTARDQKSVEVERRLKFANGSGDDLVDAVGLSLDCEEVVRYEAAGEFGNPLELIISEEEEDE